MVRWQSHVFQSTADETVATRCCLHCCVVLLGSPVLAVWILGHLWRLKSFRTAVVIVANSDRSQGQSSLYFPRRKGTSVHRRTPFVTPELGPSVLKPYLKFGGMSIYVSTPYICFYYTFLYISLL